MVITSITGTLRRTLKPEERDDVETWLNLDPRCVPERTLQSNFEPRNTFLNIREWYGLDGRLSDKQLTRLRRIYFCRNKKLEAELNGLQQLQQ